MDTKTGIRNNIYKVTYVLLSVGIIALILLHGLHNDRAVRYTGEDLNVNETMSDYYTPGILLHKGTVKVNISYASEGMVRLDFFGNANDNYIDMLPASMDGGYFEKEYYLSKDSQDTKLRFEVPEGAMLNVSEIVVRSDRLLYTDSILYAFIAAVLLWLLYFFASRRMYLGIEKDRIFAYLIMTAAVIIAFSPHLMGRLYNGNDLGGQLIRLEGVKDGILSGQFPVVLFPRTLHEYGELGAMYPYLFLVIPAGLRILNVSILTVYNVTVLSICIAVVSVMYYCLRTMCVSRVCSAMAAAVYLLSPAFIQGETINGAVLGAGFAYIFIPLVFIGIFHIVCGRTKRWRMLTVGFTGMLQSHLVTTLLMIPCFLLFAVVFAVGEGIKGRLKRDNLLSIFKAGLWCLPLNIWWIALFFYYYINADLYLGALGNTFKGMNMQSFFRLEASRYSLVFLVIGMAVIILCTGTSLKKISDEFNEKRPILLVITILGFLISFACTNVFPWDMLRNVSLVTFFTNTMQFPTRFYVVIGACAAISFGLAVDALSVLYNTHKNTIRIIAAIIIISIAAWCNIRELKEYCSPDNVFCTNITGDISPYKQREYLPDGTDDDFFEGRYGTYLSDEEHVRIEGYEKRGDRVTFTYYADDDAEDAYIELPMFYYPGYEIRTGDGTKLKVMTGDLNHMRIYLPPNSAGNRVQVRFRVRLIWSFLAMFSVCSMIIFMTILYSERTQSADYR